MIISNKLFLIHNDFFGCGYVFELRKIFRVRYSGDKLCRNFYISIFGRKIIFIKEN